MSVTRARERADGRDVLVECLRCGWPRRQERHDDCPQCGYTGWAPTEKLTEHDRKLIRERPIERRRLRLA
jgi:ribosomal protein L37E